MRHRKPREAPETPSEDAGASVDSDDVLEASGASEGSEDVQEEPTVEVEADAEVAIDPFPSRPPEPARIVLSRKKAEGWYWSHRGLYSKGHWIGVDYEGGPYGTRQQARDAALAHCNDREFNDPYPIFDSR